MAGFGFIQTGLAQPETWEQRLKAVETCIDRLISPEFRAFDFEMWGNDPLETLAGEPHHAAYLGTFPDRISHRGQPHPWRF